MLILHYRFIKIFVISIKYFIKVLWSNKSTILHTFDYILVGYIALN